MIKKNRNWFKLYACCIPIKGSNRSIIYDLQRYHFYYIPNDLYDLLSDFSEKKIFEIKNTYNNQVDEIIDDYFDFLEKNELGFYTNEPDKFPPFDKTWSIPSFITNSVIEFNGLSDFNYEDIFNQLSDLNCNGIELFFYTDYHLNKLIDIVKCVNNTRIKEVKLFLKFSDSLSLINLKKILFEQKRISYIIIHSSELDSNYFIKNQKIIANISYIKQKIDSFKHCGIIQSHHFSPNMDTYLESLHHNSCLYKKISIDVEGNIKNCPSMKQNFGNIKNITLREALNHADFKKYWNITKDQIEVCKDCEFRYICTDCRVYLEDPKNIYSKPLKCGYNPYTCEWEEWSTNPLKQKAIDHYDMRNIL